MLFYVFACSITFRYALISIAAAFSADFAMLDDLPCLLHSTPATMLDFALSLSLFSSLFFMPHYCLPRFVALSPLFSLR